MEKRKEYTVPAIDIVDIKVETVLLAGSPDTSLTGPNGEGVGNKPEVEGGSGGGPGAKPFTPWDDEEW